MTVIVLDEDELEQPRRHSVEPRKLLAGGAALLAGFSVLVLALFALTPLRSFLPGMASSEMIQNARLNQIRMEAGQSDLRLRNSTTTK